MTIKSRLTNLEKQLEKSGKDYLTGLLIFKQVDGVVKYQAGDEWVSQQEAAAGLHTIHGSKIVFAPQRDEI